MNTQQRRTALAARANAHPPRAQTAASASASAASAAPDLRANNRFAARLAMAERGAGAVCDPSAGLNCKHALVRRDLNLALDAYEQTVRARFASIEEVLRTLSGWQHERGFAERAQELARQRLDFELPQHLLEHAWVAGVDLPALHAHCVFETVARCVVLASQDQAGWRARLPLQPQQLRAFGFHTLDISPCADGRLQGLLPFILRTVPDASVVVKAYAGALFDVENDVADWSQRELERVLGLIEGGSELDYLKVAAYHYSSSHPAFEGCAAHGSCDAQAIAAAAQRLQALAAAVDNGFGQGAAPQTLLIGVDTDLDALRIHLPLPAGGFSSERYLDSAALYRQTLGLSAAAAQAAVQQAVAEHAAALGWALPAQAPLRASGLLQLVALWLEANFSQLEYVIAHHEGRYDVIGHDEAFVCAGEPVPGLQLRNQFYYAHLDTVEEGAADLDVGLKIFKQLNLQRGLPLPLLVHFGYSSRVPGSRQRAAERGLRVAAAAQQRYASYAQRGLLQCRVAVSDRWGSETLAWVDAPTPALAH